MKLKANLGADATILLTTVIWGSTFAVARDILDAWPPLAYLAVRMPLAALLFAALFPRQVFGAGRAAWRAGAAAGAPPRSRGATPKPRPSRRRRG